MASVLAVGLTTVFTGLSTSTATLIASTALYAGTFYAQYLLTQAMAPKEKSGTKLNFAFGGDVPQSIIVGTTETAGSLVYAGSHGKVGSTPNAFLVQVFVLQDMPSQELMPRIWINGEKDTIDFGAGQRTMNGNPIGYPVVGKRKGSDDKMWIRFLDGTQTVADAYLRDKFAGANKPWTSSMVGRGRTLVIVTTKYDKKEPDAIPQCRFVVKGIKVYNPKQDTTNGGSGTMRWNNQNTWAWDDNPGPIAYTIARGIYYGSEWMYGGRNWPQYALDTDSFITSINSANDDIPLKAGGSEKRAKIGGEIALNSSIFETFDEINSACNARMAESGGKLYYDLGAYSAAEFVFSDGELIVNEALDHTIQPSMQSRFNTIIATYTEPDIGGELKAIKPKSKTEFVDADGGMIRRATPTMRFCRSNRQAQRVAKAMLLDNRRVVTRQVIMGPERRTGMRANLTLSWDSTRYQYSAKRWIIGDHMLYPNGGMLVELREKDPTDDSWTPLTDEDDFIVGEWVRQVPTAQILPITVIQWPIKNALGEFKAPGFKILWSTADSDDNVDIKRVRWQVRLLDGTDIMAQGSAEFDDGFDIVAKGLVKNEPYQVRAIAVPISDWRAVDWTLWNDTTVYPSAADHIVAPNGSEIDEDAPPNLASTPTITLKTRILRSKQVRQKLTVNQDISGRDPTEHYRIRVLNTTEDPDELDHYPVDEFPKNVPVESENSYVVRVAPVSRFGVVGTYTSPATGVTMPISKYSGNLPAVSGLTIDPGIRRNAIEWTAVNRDTYPMYDYTEVQKDSSNTFPSPLVKHIASNSWVDARLANSETKYYRVRHVDTLGNFTAWSTTVSSTTVKIVDDDLDDGAPSNPTSLSLTTAAADTNEDGTQEPILLLTWTPSGSVDSKGFAIEFERSLSSGSGFTFWKKFYADGDDTSLVITPNTKYYYRAHIRARGGAKNKANASYSGYTGAVKPTKRTFGLAVGSLSVSWSAYRRKNVVRASNAPIDDAEFAYIEWYRKTGASTFTLIEKSKRDKIEDINPPSGVTGYRAKIYDITSNPSSDFTSPTTQSGGNDGIDDVITPDLAADSVKTVKVEDSAITRVKMAHNAVEVFEAFAGAGTTANLIVDVVVDHNGADHIAVWGSFVNNEGSVRNNVDVTLETAGAVTFSNVNVDLEDGNPCAIFGKLGGLGGSQVTVRLRVSGSFNKKDNRIMVVPVW